MCAKARNTNNLSRYISNFSFGSERTERRSIRMVPCIFVAILRWAVPGNLHSVQHVVVHL